MFSTDQDFLDRAKRYLHQDSSKLEDKGDLILNEGVRKMHPTFREAAILFSVIERPEGLTTLLNLRPEHLKNHGGQIGFPGGKVEEEDTGPVSTARREAMEEVGIKASKIEPIGFLDAYVTGSGFRVVPALCHVKMDEPMRLDPNEVEAAFEVPFSFLMNSDNEEHGFIEYMNKPRFYYEYNYHDGTQDWRIWGVTAGIIRLLYETIYPEFPVDQPYLENR